jgi:hypothetical protein
MNFSASIVEGSRKAMVPFTKINSMTKIKVKSLDDLEKGIKQLLLENRCSFSDEEKVFWNDCLHSVQQFKISTEKSGVPDLNLIVKVVEILTKLLVVGHDLKAIF